MRNLKKVLSLAMAMMMLVSIMSITAGAVSYSDYPDKDKITHTDAVSMLTELNVLKGTDTGAFNPTGVVTRATMAKMICVALNKGVDNGAAFVGAKASFKDTKGHWAEGYIEYVAALGIIAGDGSGKFNPDASVTGSQAAKMLLVALGYDATQEGLVGSAWQLKTTVLASSLGLFDDIATNPTATFNRDDAAQLLYNAIMNVSTVKYSDGDVEETGKTLSETKYGLLTVKGILKTNEYASLTGAAADTAGYSHIDLAALASDNGNGTSLKVATSKDLLGQEVQLYVKGTWTYTAGVATDLNVTKIYGTAVATTKNVVKTTTAALTAGTAFNAFVGTGYSLASSVLYPNYGGAITNPTTNAAGTKLTLIDNNNDKVYEYAITETYTLDQVTSVTTVNGVTTVKTVGVPAGFTTTSIVGTSALAKGDFINIAAIDNKYYVEKAATVSGALSAYVAGVSATVDSTKYVMSTGTTVAGTLTPNPTAIASYVGASNIGKTATFYLDPFGYVVATNAAAATLNYAVVVDKNSGTPGSVFDPLKVSVVKADGTAGVYTLAAPTGYVASPIKDTVYSYVMVNDSTIKLATAATTDIVKTGTIAAKTTAYAGSQLTSGNAAFADSNTVYIFYSPNTGASENAATGEKLGIVTGAANAGAYTTTAQTLPGAATDVVATAVKGTSGSTSLIKYIFIKDGVKAASSASSYLYVSALAALNPEVSVEGGVTYYTYTVSVDGATQPLKTISSSVTAGINTQSTADGKVSLSPVTATETNGAVTYVDPTGSYIVINNSTVYNVASTTKVYDVTAAGAGAATTFSVGQAVTLFNGSTSIAVAYVTADYRTLANVAVTNTAVVTTLNSTNKTMTVATASATIGDVTGAVSASYGAVVTFTDATGIAKTGAATALVSTDKMVITSADGTVVNTYVITVA